MRQVGTGSGEGEEIGWETEERGGGENRIKEGAIEDREGVKEEVMQAVPSSQVSNQSLRFLAAT